MRGKGRGQGNRGKRGRDRQNRGGVPEVLTSASQEPGIDTHHRDTNFNFDNPTNLPAGAEINDTKTDPKIISTPNKINTPDLHNKGSKRIKLDISNQNTIPYERDNNINNGVKETLQIKIDWRENISKKIPNNLIPKSAPVMIKKSKSKCLQARDCD